MDREEKLYTAALNTIFRYNCKPARELIEITGSARAVFSLNRSDLKEIFGKEYTFINDICDKRAVEEAAKEISWAESAGIEVLVFSDTEGGYPYRLLECSDYPLVIFKRGTSALDASSVISIVGTRRASATGTEVCRKIISELANLGLNPLIVSGLAFGIDITAHRCALENNLRTIAVLGSSLDSIYPVSHGKYASAIERDGALVTEFPRNSLSFKINFIRRNRIIAGMSDAVIVAESGERGGSMITASLASSYAREVFAVPGRPGDVRSRGCNLLISKNLASLFYSTESFAEHMGWNLSQKKGERVQKVLFTSYSREKEKILVALASAQEAGIDELTRMTGLNIREISSNLLELELEGAIASLPGKRFLLVK